MMTTDKTYIGIGRFYALLAIPIFQICGISAANAQTARNTARTVTVQGVLTSDADGSAVDLAAVFLFPSKLYAMTDSKGEFNISNVPAGEIRLNVQYFGMEEIDTTFTARAGQRVYLQLKMKETSFRLENVVITATRSKAGNSTASNISRQAMDHMQTSSLQDVMALLPGVSISNPNLSSAQGLTLRTVSGGSATSNMNSLGTAVMIDGAPVSNNSNLQTLNPIIDGSLSTSAGGASPAGGVDVRSISTDNIESIEVIRGIPSVEYGDATSGAVLVKSKAGKSPWTIRFKTNPNIYQTSVSKGFALSPKAGDLNISGDYAYNRNSLTKAFEFYQRANLKGLWSVRINDHTTANTSLSLNYGKDTQNKNPDTERLNTHSYANEIGLRLNSNGQSNINRGWLRSVNWLLSGSWNDKKSYYASTATNAMNLYSTAMSDMVYSNFAGVNIYDADGKAITTITDATSNVKGTVMPYSYGYDYYIYGQEVNVFAKLNTELGKSWEKGTERILIGVDFKSDGNLGKGSVYDDATPPFRSISNTDSGYRRRSFYDIPFVNQIGAYAESSFNWKLAGRELNLSAGLRFDWVNSLTALSPRINASFEIIPDAVAVRGGWGITSKAPTSMYLYPNKAYHDVINYNGMSVNTPEAERLLIATTTVYDASNKDLEIAQNRKAEIGLDFTIAKKYRISLTGYDEYMSNGYNFGLGLDSFIYSDYITYKAAKTNAGAPPVLEQDQVYKTFFTIYKPHNDIVSKNRGVEYEIDLGRFDPIRTSFYINGAWMTSSSSNGNYSFSTRSKSGSIERNIGVYNPHKETDWVEKFNTTFRITHNIPKIGFVVTLTGQFNWYTKYWTSYRNDEMFVKYISRLDGQVHDFDPSMRNDEEFSYLFPTLSGNRFIVEKYPTTFLCNLNVTKEIGDMMTASFYVNNIFNSRPLYRYKASGGKTELGIPIFFGFELKITIK